MTRDERETQIREMLSETLCAFRERDNLKARVSRLEDMNKVLEEENRKLKYEYEDSKLNRDKPLPYKWRTVGPPDHRHFPMFCPKCEMGIANWYNYCHACGQKIGQGNPQPEMEIRKGESE